MPSTKDEILTVVSEDRLLKTIDKCTHIFDLDGVQIDNYGMLKDIIYDLDVEESCTDSILEFCKEHDYKVMNLKVNNKHVDYIILAPETDVKQVESDFKDFYLDDEVIVELRESTDFLQDAQKKAKKSDKKHSRGYFVNTNAGDVETGIKMLNHALGADKVSSTDGTSTSLGTGTSSAGVGESLNEETDSNIWYHGGVSSVYNFKDRESNWFSKDKEYAIYYAKHKVKGMTKGTVNTVYISECELDTSNLYDVGEVDKRVYGLVPIQPYTISDEFLSCIEKLNLSEDEIRSLLDSVCKEWKMINDGYKMRISDVTNSKSFRDLLISKGYSGIKAREVNEDSGSISDTVCIFESSKIKLINTETINESLKEGLKNQRVSLKRKVEEKIEKHDELNPVLWDENQELRPEVREKIQKVVDRFVSNLSWDEIPIKINDILILGSNANYNYTDASDIDVHIVADTESLDCDKKHLSKIYNAYKSLFNDKYDPKIKGYEIEVYVENNLTTANSNGIYSFNDGWIKKPEKVVIPDVDITKDFEEWENKYLELLKEVGVSHEE